MCVSDMRHSLSVWDVGGDLSLLFSVFCSSTSHFYKFFSLQVAVFVCRHCLIYLTGYVELLFCNLFIFHSQIPLDPSFCPRKVYAILIYDDL